MELHERLNLKLAWERVKEDLNNHCFINNPFEISLIESDLDNWLDSLRKQIQENRYNPSKSKIIDFPKEDWHLRPGSIMIIEDMVVYSALLLDCIEKIRKGIGSAARKRKFSHILKEKQESNQWFQFGLTGWMKFKDESLELIDKGYDHVLFTDISAFFENVDLVRLISDLESMDIPEDIRRLLSKCLNRWAQPRGRGLPQGVSTSHVLAEVYLDTIDKRLINNGIKYLRYVDDVRIFCKSKKEAINALHLLTGLYRQKGLNLQTAKSKITPKEKAIKKISGISSIISKLNKEIIKEMQEHLDLQSPYGTPSEIRAITKKNSKVKIQVLIGSFEKYFLSDTKIEFDKSLFHFFINRLGALQNSKAVDYCLNLLLEQPEETKPIFDYFSNLPKSYTYIAEHLALLLEDEAVIYEYQKFKIVRFFFDNKIPSSLLLTAIRNLVTKADLLQNTKDVCIAYLGEHGDLSDLDLLETFYEEFSNPISKAGVIHSLRKMPRSRRNSIYGRARGDGYYVDLAITLART